MNPKERLNLLLVNALKSRGVYDQPQYRQRLVLELKELEKQNEYEYFLDLVEKKYAFSDNENNMLIPWLLGLVTQFDIDALPKYEYGDFPDIDVDFIDDVRDYLKNEWAPKTFGEKNVCNIGNYTTFGIKSSLIDMARIYAEPREEILAVTTQLGLKDEDGKPLTWDKALESDPKLKAYCEAHPELADSAKRLIDRNRGRGKHAGGLIISRTPIDRLVPLVVDNDGLPVSSWSEGLHSQDLQPVGLVKYDLLNITNLKQIARISRLVKERYGLSHISALPGLSDFSDIAYLNDPKSLELANEAKLKCVFQFDSPGIRQMVRDGGVTCFDDLVAYTSLYRPGPLGEGMHTHFINRKKGDEDYDLHPILEPYLRSTHGVLVFQEQVMQILNIVGDIPLKDCEIVRKAISKKKEKIFLKYKVMFLENGQKNLGWPIEQVQALWDQIAAFAEYGFNKSHAVAYTYISSRLLYLKAHYPIEFFAGILESETNEDKIKEYKLDSERFGIQVNPVNLNKSGVNFKILDKEIFIGFSNIKGLGAEVAQRIVAGQPYESFEDFLVRFGTDANVLKPLVGLGVFAECQREPWVVPMLPKLTEVEDVEVDEEVPQIKVTAVGETITVNPRVALFEFAEFYKDKMKKRDDRFKRNRKSLDGRVEELRFLLPEDLKDQAGDEWFLKRLEMSEDAFTLVMNAVGGLDVKALWKVLQKYKKSYGDNQKKVAADGPVLLKDFVPTGDIESKLKLIYEDDLLASELAYYGFGWNHMLEKSPDYEGGYTFAELSRRAEEQGVLAGMVEVQVIEVPKLKKSKKETNYYVLRVEDNEWQQAGVTVWEDDFQRFEEEFNFWESESRRGNLLKCRLMVPTPPFKNYTFYAPPKHRRQFEIPEDKALDPRLAVMRRP